MIPVLKMATFVYILVLVICCVNGETTFCKKSYNESSGCLYEVDECLYLWLDSVSIKVKIAGESPFTANIPSNQTLTAVGQCSDGKNSSTSLKVNYKISNENITGLELEFKILPQTEDGWNIQSISIEPKINGLADLKHTFRRNEYHGAGYNFSFSCADLKLEGEDVREHKGENKTVKFDLTLKRFQIQPFKEEETVFASSYDCTTWMTLSTWMGFLTILFFTFILAVGVYYLAEIKTPDRFENPKSKPLAIAVSD